MENKHDEKKEQEEPDMDGETVKPMEEETQPDQEIQPAEEEPLEDDEQPLDKGLEKEEEPALEQSDVDDVQPAIERSTANFCKLKDLKNPDSPQYYLIYHSKFVVDQVPSLNLLWSEIVQVLGLEENQNDSSLPTKLCYVDADGDYIALTSDEELERVLGLSMEPLKLALNRTFNSNSQPSFEVTLKAKWNDYLVTHFGSHRLMAAPTKKDSPETVLGLSFDKLIEIASAQFQVPRICLAFNLQPSENNATTKRITNDHDLMDACYALKDGDSLQLQVQKALCSVIRVTYPTIHNDTLFRSIPLETLTEDLEDYDDDDDDDDTVERATTEKSRLSFNKTQISYEKLLLNIADSLGTDEFVLTYTLQSETDSAAITYQAPKGKITKYFIASWNDLINALQQCARNNQEELVVIPRIPDDNDFNTMQQPPAENVLSVDNSEQKESTLALKADGDLKLETNAAVQFTLLGKEEAIVEFPMDSLIVENSNGRTPSYWKAIELVTKAFHLGNSPRVCLFYVAKDGSKAEIQSDHYLNEIMVGIWKRNAKEGEAALLRIRVEPVLFSIAAQNNGFVVRNFALSHVLYENGVSLSLLKLLRLARMVDPILGLTYVNTTGVKTSIVSDQDFLEAIKDYPRGDLLIRPHLQENPFVLNVRNAFLTGKKCKIGSWTTPNIMIKTESGICLWDLSQLLPGKYQFSTQYWRDLNKGEVILSVGVVVGSESRHVLNYLARAEPSVRRDMLTSVTLAATGLNEWAFSKDTEFGKFDVRSRVNSGSDTAFLIVAAEKDQHDPEVYISNMKCTYTGPLDKPPV